MKSNQDNDNPYWHTESSGLGEVALNLLSRKESPRDYDGQQSGVTLWDRNVHPVKGHLWSETTSNPSKGEEEKPQRRVQRAATTEALWGRLLLQPQATERPSGSGFWL